MIAFTARSRRAAWARVASSRGDWASHVVYPRRAIPRIREQAGDDDNHIQSHDVLALCEDAALLPFLWRDLSTSAFELDFEPPLRKARDAASLRGISCVRKVRRGSGLTYWPPGPPPRRTSLP
jgi:hypothetical protein